MKPRYIAIVIITSLATASFTAAFVMFNSNYANSAVVRVKEISPDRETIDYNVIMREISQIKADQENISKRLAAITEALPSMESTHSDSNEDDANKEGEEQAESGSDTAQTETEQKPETANSVAPTAEKKQESSEQADKKQEKPDVKKKVTQADEKPKKEDKATKDKPKEKVAQNKKQKTEEKTSEKTSSESTKKNTKNNDKNLQLVKLDKKPKPAAIKAPPISKVRSGRHTYLVREFKKEARDPNWSAAAMMQIMDSITKKVTKKSEFVSMDCRTTFCRLQFNHANKQMAGKFIKRLSEALKWSNSTLEVFFVKDTQIVTDIFVFRSEEL